jgi:hypothetical protein
MAGAAHVSARPPSVKLGSVAVRRIDRDRRDDVLSLSSGSRAPSGQTQLPIQCRSHLSPTSKAIWSADSRKSFIRATVPFVVLTLSMTAYWWLDISLFTSNRSDVIVKTLTAAFRWWSQPCRPSGRLSDQRASPSSCIGTHSVGILHIGWEDATTIRTDSKQAREYLPGTDRTYMGLPRKPSASYRDFLPQFKPISFASTRRRDASRISSACATGSTRCARTTRWLILWPT